MPKSRFPNRPQLTREQLAEVIRANVAAFKEDPNFYDYLTELVIYLMEYEYAWPREEASRTSLGATKTGKPAHTAADDPRQTKYRFEFIQPIELNSPAAMSRKRFCRLCGSSIGNKLICPNCLMRNR